MFNKNNQTVNLDRGTLIFLCEDTNYIKLLKVGLLPLNVDNILLKVGHTFKSRHLTLKYRHLTLTCRHLTLKCRHLTLNGERLTLKSRHFL